MKTHIMTSMSSGYDSVVVKYRGELAETPLTKLRKEIGLQYTGDEKYPIWKPVMVCFQDKTKMS
jgi:hypothetical protein